MTIQYATYGAPESELVSSVPPGPGVILSVDALLQLVGLIGRLRSPVNEAGGEARCPGKTSPPVPGVGDAARRPAGDGGPATGCVGGQDRDRSEPRWV
jgi:hypothetical protein